MILRGVNSEAEGSYKCEVSAEGTFHTDFAEANLTVIGKYIDLIIIMILNDASDDCIFIFLLGDFQMSKTKP